MNFRRLLVGMLIAAFFTGGFVLGRRSLDTSRAEPAAVDLASFWEAWSAIDENYLHEVNDNDRLDGAIYGLLRSLGDPYSIYLPKSENDIFQSNLTGHFSGIGAEIAAIDGLPTIVSPLAGSPSQRAGLRARDVILKVDDLDAATADFSTVINNIRGEEGSEVRLTVFREGEEAELLFTVKREVIVVESVQAAVKSQAGVTYGHLIVSQFLEDTEKKVRDSLESWRAQGVEKVVLDMRHNPGGLLDAAVDVTSLLLDTSTQPEFGDTIVFRQERDGQNIPFKATRDPLFADFKLVVLVNEGSASAAEIVAGALADYGRAPLVGQTTFGKGSVQELIDLKNGGSVKMTVAHWLSPARTEIDKKGITPNHLVENSGENDALLDENSDAQLAAAVELLR